MRWVLPVALLLAFSALARAEIDVQIRGERVAVRAHAAALADVLERLAQKTGMKIVYDGAPPRTLVTASLEDRTPAEAVLTLLEGLGLNYAVKLDASGTKVDTLLMTGTAGPGNAPAAAPTPRPVSAPLVRPPRPEPEEEEEDMPEDHEPVTPVRPGRRPGMPGGEEEAGSPAGRTPQAPGGRSYPVSPFAPAAPPPPAVVAPVPSPTPPPDDDEQ